MYSLLRPTALSKLSPHLLRTLVFSAPSSLSVSAALSVSVSSSSINRSQRHASSLRFFSSSSSSSSSTDSNKEMEELMKKFSAEMDALNKDKENGIKDATTAPVGDHNKDGDMKMDFDTAVDEEIKEEELNPPPPSTEQKSGAATTRSFQAETKQILDIMAKSLYTEKEIFLRELISNASDALEKLRYHQASGAVNDEKAAAAVQTENQQRPLEIRIWADTKQNQLIIQDSGIGMNEDEMIDNLGTIAKSGSKKFVKDLLNKTAEGGGSSTTAPPSSDTVQNIIGQFGVGFYSSFMVADKIEVYSRSAKSQTMDGSYWCSTGDGSYTIQPATGVERGTKIILHMREDAKEFIGTHILEGIVRKYSNFVSFPIYLHNQLVNSTGALWQKDPKSINEADYTQFYSTFCNAYDTPTYRLHFHSDVPLSMHALIYFPERHMEKWGMGPQEPSVDLYSRRVLIQPKSKNILPNWARFLKGVVDSEDLPLNISRETMQDSRLLQKINTALVKKIIRYLNDQSKENPTKFNKWYQEFQNFLKEGVCTDWMNKTDLAKILRFETSVKGDKTEGGVENNYWTFDEYISRMKPTQKAIYFLMAPNRAYALASPYYEAMKSKGIEVIFCYQPIDEFVMKQLEEYSKRKLVSVDSTEANKEFQDEKKEEEKKEDGSVSEVKGESLTKLISYMTTILSDRTQSITVTQRPISAPAILVDHESASTRRMMKSLNMDMNAGSKQKIELNTKHPILIKLSEIINREDAETHKHISSMIVEQIFDNALIAADLLDNPRSSLPRIQKLMEMALNNASASQTK